jgi:hypothetical protein
MVQDRRSVLWLSIQALSGQQIEPHLTIQLVYKCLKSITRDICGQVHCRSQGFAVFFRYELDHDMWGWLDRFRLWCGNAMIDLLSLGRRKRNRHSLTGRESKGSLVNLLLRGCS